MHRALVRKAGGISQKKQSPAKDLTGRQSADQAFAVFSGAGTGSTAERFCNTVQMMMAPSKSKTASAANSGLKPMVSASAPTTSANRVLAVQAAIPVSPLAVATSLRPNTSEESVISAPDSDW